MRLQKGHHRDVGPFDPWCLDSLVWLRFGCLWWASGEYEFINRRMAVIFLTRFLSQIVFCLLIPYSISKLLIQKRRRCDESES